MNMDRSLGRAELEQRSVDDEVTIDPGGPPIVLLRGTGVDDLAC